jgi:hypothetical protein
MERKGSEKRKFVIVTFPRGRFSHRVDGDGGEREGGGGCQKCIKKEARENFYFLPQVASQTDSYTGVAAAAA